MSRLSTNTVLMTYQYTSHRVQLTSEHKAASSLVSGLGLFFARVGERGLVTTLRATFTASLLHNIPYQMHRIAWLRFRSDPAVVMINKGCVLVLSIATLATIHFNV